jgi:predicted nucleic acid-binding protein
LIYVDTSVALAHLLAEDRHPAASLWNESLVSSRLLQYELFVRLNARRLIKSHSDAAYQLVGRLAILELSQIVLARALEPFPVELRTLDALHVASVEFLRAQSIDVSLLTYDSRMQEAAKALRIPLASFD